MPPPTLTTRQNNTVGLASNGGCGLQKATAPSTQLPQVGRVRFESIKITQHGKGVREDVGGVRKMGGQQLL